jgi:hypothetical protein
VHRRSRRRLSTKSHRWQARHRVSELVTLVGVKGIMHKPSLPFSILTFQDKRCPHPWPSASFIESDAVFQNHRGGQAMEVIRCREGDCRQEIGCAVERGRTRATQRLDPQRQAFCPTFDEGGILLKADASSAGEGWNDSRIAEALDTSISTILRTDNATSPENQRRLEPAHGIYTGTRNLRYEVLIEVPEALARRDWCRLRTNCPTAR